MESLEVAQPASTSSVVTIIPLLLFAGLVLFLIFWVIPKLKRLQNNLKVKRANGEGKKLNPIFKILCVLGFVIDFVIIGFIKGWDFSPGVVIAMMIGLIIPGILSQCLYFLPYLIAHGKVHQQETAIFVLNLFAGWTVIAWIICLVWAFTKPKQEKIVSSLPSIAKQIEEYKDLLDKGILTEEEFSEKKKQLLQ